MDAAEQILAKGQEIVKIAQGLDDYIVGAAKDGTAAHVVEQNTMQIVLKMGNAAMKLFFSLEGTGDLGPSVTLPDGRVVRRLETLHTRDYLSIFGLFTLERTVYGSREGQKLDFIPLDARLSLPESKFSYLLQDWDQMIATQEPYNEVSSFLERILGLPQHVDSLERMSREMAREADRFCWTCKTPPPAEEGEILVESADGKGVPIRRPADAPAIFDHQHRPGPKPDRKKMATVGSVYTVDRYVRTPEEIVEALFREPGEDRPESNRPEPCHKHGYARLFCVTDDGEIVDGQAGVFCWIADQVRRRDPDGTKEKVCIMDGQESLWNTKDLIQGCDFASVNILDLLHVTPRLWKAAHMFHARESREAAKFVRIRVLRVLRGETSSVIRGLRCMATARKLSSGQRKDIRQICAYFEKNKRRMHYNEYLEKGYPIASGVIEGACRHLVKDRLERTGMNWTVPGAEAMLELRCIYINGQWEKFVKYRIARENERLYPYRKFVQQCDWALAV